MRNLMFVMALGVALLAPVAGAHPNDNGCKSSDDKPKKCNDDPKSMPEPNSVILLGAGLLGLGGLSAFLSKTQNQ